MPLNIRINDDYKITSDTYNVIVNRRHISDPTKAPNWEKRKAEGADPTPKETWREVAYCRNVEQALEWILDRQVKESDAETFSDLLREIRQFRREINEILHG
ncbi:hypothetical protein Q8A72_07100 [Aeribacillus pallidus]|nr:hypothetical protein [Aeribacillus pallidus]